MKAASTYTTFATDSFCHSTSVSNRFLQVGQFFSNKINFFAVSLSGVVFVRVLDTKSKFLILNLIGQ